jgi:hypothetical protein
LDSPPSWDLTSVLIYKAQPSAGAAPTVTGPLKLTGRPSGTNIWSRIHLTNLRANEAYIMKWGNESRTPAAWGLYFGDMTPGEWLQVASPYPPGVTFRVSDSEDTNVNYTRVYSRVELKKRTYWYDDATSLLWFHIESSLADFSWNYGIAATSQFFSIGVRAYGCPSAPYCTKTWDVSTLSASGGNAMPTQLSPKVQRPICQAFGTYSNSRVKLTPRTVQPYSIFSDSLSPNWATQTNPGIFRSQNWTLNYCSPSDSVCIGAASMAVLFGGSRRLIFYPIGSDAAGVDINSYTHLEFSIKLSDGDGPIRLYVDAQDNSSSTDANQRVSLAVREPLTNPDYIFRRGSLVSAGAPIGDAKHFGSADWITIRVPLSSFGPGRVGYLHQFRIWNGVRTVTMYIDDIKLAAYDVSREKVLLQDGLFPFLLEQRGFTGLSQSGQDAVNKYSSSYWSTPNAPQDWPIPEFSFYNQAPQQVTVAPYSAPTPRDNRVPSSSKGSPAPGAGNGKVSAAASLDAAFSALYLLVIACMLAF